MIWAHLLNTDTNRFTERLCQSFSLAHLQWKYLTAGNRSEWRVSTKCLCHTLITNKVSIKLFDVFVKITITRTRKPTQTMYGTDKTDYQKLTQHTHSYCCFSSARMASYKYCPTSNLALSYNFQYYTGSTSSWHLSHHALWYFPSFQSIIQSQTTNMWVSTCIYRS